MSKLNAHWINTHGYDLSVVKSFGGDWVKVVDPDPEQVARLKEELGLKVLARLSRMRGPTNYNDAKGLAREHHMMIHSHKCHGAVDAWETVNEPGQLDYLSVQEYLSEYYLEMIHQANRCGDVLCICNFSNGNPPGKNNEGPADWSAFEAVLDAARGRHYLGLHEYWGWGEVEDFSPWWAGRSSFVPGDVRIMITECGFNRSVGAHNTSDKGWRGVMNAEEYLRDLEQYYTLINRDPRIVAAFVFTLDYASSDWESFDTLEVAGRIGQINEMFVPEFEHVPDSEPGPSPVSETLARLILRLQNITNSLDHIADEVSLVASALDDLA